MEVLSDSPNTEQRRALERLEEMLDHPVFLASSADAKLGTFTQRVIDADAVLVSLQPEPSIFDREQYNRAEYMYVRYEDAADLQVWMQTAGYRDSPFVWEHEPIAAPDGMHLEELEGATPYLGTWDRENHVLYLNLWANRIRVTRQHHIDVLQTIVDHVNTAFTPLTDEERQARTEAALAEWGSTIHNTRVTDTRREIDLHREAIVGFQNALFREHTAVRDKAHLLAALMDSAPNMADVMEQYNLTLDHARVESVSFRGGVFTVLTTPDLRMTRPSTGDVRWLGQFRMELSVDGTRGIKLHNLNTRRAGWNHPHVEGNGNPCFGGTSETIYELLAAGELFATVDLLIQYLETLNERDDWGRHGAFWFDVPDEDLALQSVVEAVEEAELVTA